MIHFVPATTAQPATAHIVRAIQTALRKKQRVLWLLSGGSAIQIAVDARRQLGATDNLTVMQVDERFGPAGHRDSNWQQLLDAGFDTAGITCNPMLSGAGGLADTAAAYEQTLADALAAADTVISLFGIGADGHTAGILPHSAALQATGLVASYTAADFARITITAAAIAQVDLAIAYASGHKKAAALHNLQKDLPPTEQPAQILKQIKEVYVYNDAIGEELL